MSATILINGEEHEVEAKAVTLLLHKDVMQIEMPNRFEINPQNTLEEVRKLDQRKWAYITSGEIFQFLFRKVFVDANSPENIHEVKTVSIPEKIEDLLKADLGVQHVSGLIILAMTQGGIQGKELFFKLPETYLHPAYQAQLGDLFIVLPQVVEFLKEGTNPPVMKPPTAMEQWLG